MARSRGTFGASVLNAIRGLAFVAKTQRNMRIHLLAAALVVAAGWWLGVSGLEWGLLVLAMALVISAELGNTALESLADALHPGEGPLVGWAKDAAAAGVLVSALGATLVGLLVLGPRLLALFSR